MAEQQESMTPDAVVEEVREIRRRIWREVGNDVRRLLARLDRDVPWNRESGAAANGKQNGGPLKRLPKD